MLHDMTTDTEKLRFTEYNNIIAVADQSCHFESCMHATYIRHAWGLAAHFDWVCFLFHRQECP